MPKGVPQKRYTGEFKQKVVETMHKEKLSYNETSKRFGISGHTRVASWEQIYLEEGPEGLYIDRKRRAMTADETKQVRPPKPDKTVEKDLIAEVERLRAENAYLKKLNALVSERARQEKKHK